MSINLKYLTYSIKEISFEDILPCWKYKLWPERTSEIKPVSRINLDGNIDMQMTISLQIYLGAFYNDSIVGVASGHTTEKTYRLRGLWVDSDHRQRGLGKTLFNECQRSAAENNYKSAWCMSRLSNVQMYKNWGFVPHKHIDGYDYGPHLLMTREWTIE